MKAYNRLKNHIQLGYNRIRYPFSMPEEVGLDLGLDITNALNFESFLEFLSSGSCLPQNLEKYMRREEVERFFAHPFRTDHFQDKTLFSYYFKQGWVEFELKFDCENRLRRMWLHLPGEEDLEIKLPKNS
ncbi:MAG: hypothetical protein K940chlam3_01633 [Chlamydiae bacterium]|nr:hypothetical protein [Chlamydiota bacterium]